MSCTCEEKTRHLGEEQPPVVLPAAVLDQDVRVFVHQPLFVIDGSLLLIAQDSVDFPQDLEHNRDTQVTPTRPGGSSSTLQKTAFS